MIDVLLFNFQLVPSVQLTELRVLFSSFIVKQLVVDEVRQLEIYNIWDKTYTKEEICSLLSTIGFIDVEFYNNFFGNPYTEECETICVLARISKYYSHIYRSC